MRVNERIRVPEVRVIDENGTVRRIRVCARYIKAGKFTKAPPRSAKA